MGKKILVALTMEGKFAGEGLRSIDEDDDMLSAMARELVERSGVGESADAVWKALKSRTSEVQSADDLESVQCVHVRIQGTGAHSSVQSNREIE